jgi:phosphoglycolate phosphatase-like HAD superfamily hydrolase
MSAVIAGGAPLGRVPIVDFDGTMAYLPIDWAALRRQLGVGSINELWTGADGGAGWATVTAAELAATTHARPIAITLEALAAASGFVVVTDNDESVVSTFLARYPWLAAKVLAVLGRRYHGGPKRDPEVFARAFRMASELIRRTGSDQPIVYCGDQDYELAFAISLGAQAVRVLLSGELAPATALADASPGRP